MSLYINIGCCVLMSCTAIAGFASGIYAEAFFCATVAIFTGLNAALSICTKDS